MSNVRGGGTIGTAGVALRRRAVLALAVFALVVTVGAAVTFSLPGIYRATATLLVEPDPVPSAIGRPAVGNDIDTRLKSATERILSRARLTEIIDRFGLYSDLKPRLTAEEIVARMRSDVAISVSAARASSARGDTLVLESTYRALRPDTAAGVANAIAALFIDQDARARAERAGDANAVVDARLSELKENLTKAESEIARFKDAHIGELPEQLGSNSAAIERLHSEREHLDDRRQALLDKRDAPAPVATPGSIAGGTPEARLVGLRQELARLLTRYQSNHPDVVAVRGAIASAEAEVAAEPSARRTDPDAEIRRIDLEQDRLAREIARYQARVENTARRQQEIDELTRRYATAREMYESMLHRDEDARLTRSAETRTNGESFRILDPAVAPRHPFAPDRPKLLLAVLLSALALSAIAVAARERLDTSFHTAEDLREFARAPVLGSLPLIVTPRRKSLLRLRTVAAVVLTAAAIATLTAGASRVARHHDDWVALIARGAK